MMDLLRIRVRRFKRRFFIFGIDELFREAGIVIAFPQRDIHLDTHKPLEFRMVNTKDTSKDTGEQIDN